MKIGIITPSFPPYFGGTGNVAYNHAVELVKLGHDITVFTPDFGDYDYPKEINVKRLKPIFKIGNAPFLLDLLKIKKEDFDLFHLHAPYFFGAEIVWLLSKLGKIPYVMNYQMDVRLKGPLHLFAYSYNKIILPIIFKRAKKVIVSSMDYAHHSEIKDFSNVVELPNGVDLKRFNPNLEGNSVRKKHDIIGKIVLFVGALDKAHYFKGVDVLLESFKGINATLLIVGGGNLKEMYAKEAEKLGIKEKVIFAGRVSEEELPEYYASCDLLVLPSTTIGEAFGLVLIEAMAAGKPVITSNLPGIRKTIKGCGLLTEPKNVKQLKDKINLLLQKNDLRKKFGMRGRIISEQKYEWSTIAKKLERIYYEN